MVIGLAFVAAFVASQGGCGPDRPKMSVEDLHAAIDSDGASLIIVDVRQRNLYGKGHVPGARNIPLEEIPAVAGKLAASKGRIAVICTCGRRSIAAIDLLRREGLDPILVEGGMKAWRDAQLPTERAGAR